MTEQAAALLQKAMELSEQERAQLASSLLESLDPATDGDVQAAWDQEISKRIADLDSGKAKTVPWPEALTRLTSNLPDGK